MSVHGVMSRVPNWLQLVIGLLQNKTWMLLKPEPKKICTDFFLSLQIKWQIAKATDNMKLCFNLYCYAYQWKGASQTLWIKSVYLCWLGSSNTLGWTSTIAYVFWQMILAKDDLRTSSSWTESNDENYFIISVFFQQGFIEASKGFLENFICRTIPKVYIGSVKC